MNLADAKPIEVKVNCLHNPTYRGFVPEVKTTSAPKQVTRISQAIEQGGNSSTTIQTAGDPLGKPIQQNYNPDSVYENRAS